MGSAVCPAPCALLDCLLMPSVLREVGETFEALVKGFSVTFRNIFRKTVTENYPYEPVHFHMCSTATRMGWRNVWDAFCARPHVPPTAFTLKPRKTRTRTASQRASAMLRCTTLIIRAAFFVVIVSKLVRPMQSRTATGLSWPRMTSILLFTAKSSFWKRQSQFPQVQPVNSFFLSLILL